MKRSWLADGVRLLLLTACVAVTSAVRAQVADNPLSTASTHQPHEIGVFLQGGNGVTDQRDGFHFLSAGVRAGWVLTNNFGAGALRSNFEYGVEILPYWQSFTPKFQRVSCSLVPVVATTTCSQPYTVGGTFSGVSLTPIVLRVNSARRGRVVPWIQGAGGVLWTNHKYPAYGDTSNNYNVNGPNGDTSVWNFTPQFGVGAHVFTRPGRSVDFAANAVHISSASLGDRNPGVNVSLQFSVGYSFWK